MGSGSSRQLETVYYRCDAAGYFCAGVHVLGNYCIPLYSLESAVAEYIDCIDSIDVLVDVFGNPGCGIIENG